MKNFNILVYLVLFFAASLMLPGHAIAADGPLPAEYAKWDQSVKQQQRDAGVKLLAMIDRAVKQGEKDISIPKAHYRFAETDDNRRPAHINWQEFDGVTLDFNGSTLWFENPRTGIVLYRCKDTKLTNVTLDWDPLPYFQGEVIEVMHDQGRFRMSIDPGYVPTHPRMMQGGRWRGVVFDESRQEFKGGQGGYEVGVDWSQLSGDNVLDCSFHGFYGLTMKELNIEEGDPIAVFPRIGRAIRVELCDRPVLENINIHASPFVTIAQNGGLGTPIYRKINIVRRPDTNRLMASNADGINVANVQFGPLIEDCKITYLGDDCINVHSAYMRVAWQEAPNLLVTSPIFSEALAQVRSGESVEVMLFDRETSELLGTRQIVSAVSIPNVTLDANKLLPGIAEHQWHSGDGSAIQPGRTTWVHKLTLDEPINLKRDTMMVLPEFMSEGAVIRNVEGRASLARGFRLQSPGLLVENCEIINTLGQGISLGGQPGYWGEGPFVQNAKLINNRLIDTCNAVSPQEGAAIHVRQGGDYDSNRIQKNIQIIDNEIKGSGTWGIVVRGVSGLEIRGNTIENYWYLKPTPLRKPVPSDREGWRYGVAIEASDNVVMENNHIANPGQYAKGDLFKADVKMSSSEPE